LGEGGGDVLGHFLALGFVVGEEVVARGGGGGVENDGEMGGGLVGEDVQEGVGEAEEGGGVDAIAGEDGVANEGEVGAVSERHAVEEEKPICHDGRMVAEGRGVVDGRLSIEGRVDGRRLLGYDCCYDEEISCDGTCLPNDGFGRGGACGDGSGCGDGGSEAEARG
jgi:hypothetical protein